MKIKHFETEEELIKLEKDIAREKKKKDRKKILLREENGDIINAEIVAEFTVAIDIPKGTKARIYKTNKGYFVCSRNNKIKEQK